MNLLDPGSKTNRRHPREKLSYDIQIVIATISHWLVRRSQKVCKGNGDIDDGVWKMRAIEASGGPVIEYVELQILNDWMIETTLVIISVGAPTWVMAIEITYKYAIIGHDVKYTTYHWLGYVNMRGNVTGPEIQIRGIAEEDFHIN